MCQIASTAASWRARQPLVVHSNTVLHKRPHSKLMMAGGIFETLHTTAPLYTPPSHTRCRWRSAWCLPHRQLGCELTSIPPPAHGRLWSQVERARKAPLCSCLAYPSWTSTYIGDCLGLARENARSWPLGSPIPPCASWPPSIMSRHLGQQPNGLTSDWYDGASPLP